MGLLDNVDSEIHKFRARVLKKYNLSLNIYKLQDLRMLGREYKEASKVIKRYRGAGNKSYNDYLNACKKAKVTANDLGLTCNTNPVRNPPDIKIEIVCLIKEGKLNKQDEINPVLRAMGIIEKDPHANVRLPNSSALKAHSDEVKAKQTKVDSSWEDWLSDEIDNYIEPTEADLEEYEYEQKLMEQEERKLLNEINSTFKQKSN